MSSSTNHMNQVKHEQGAQQDFVLWPIQSTCSDSSITCPRHSWFGIQTNYVWDVLYRSQSKYKSYL